jgi:ribosomal protein S25
VKGTKSLGRKKTAELTEEMRKEIHALWAMNTTLTKYDLQEKFGINLSQAKHMLENMPIFVHRQSSEE